MPHSYREKFLIFPFQVKGKYGTVERVKKRKKEPYFMSFRGCDRGDLELNRSIAHLSKALKGGGGGYLNNTLLGGHKKGGV
jgi:hypothetical protein